MEMKNLFVTQSYQDNIKAYEGILSERRKVPLWDYVILTAANADQADAYQLQIEYRKRNKRLPQDTKYLVIPDPGGKRIGSGGSTMHVLREIARVEGSGRLSELKILLLHSGGDARRIPQYSA